MGSPKGREAGPCPPARPVSSLARPIVKFPLLFAGAAAGRSRMVAHREAKTWEDRPLTGVGGGGGVGWGVGWGWVNGQGAQATAVKHLGADGGEATDVTFDLSGSYIGFANGNAIRVCTAPPATPACGPAYREGRQAGGRAAWAVLACLRERRAEARLPLRTRGCGRC